MKNEKLLSVLHFPVECGKCLRKTVILSSLMTMMALVPSGSSAQNNFILGFECHSGNLWSESFLGIPTRIINSIILAKQGYDIDENGSFPGSAFTYRFNRIKVDGQKVDYDGNHFFGFKGVDLFRDFEYSLKFGWQPSEIPVGFYAKVGYRHENFETRLNGEEEWTKHRLNCLRPGISIRISPLENMIYEYSWCPIIEIGSTYDYYLSYKGAYDKDKNQLNNGISTCIGIGAKFESGSAIMLTFDRQNYDLFNKDFTVNGVKPYENVETNHFNIQLSMSLGL